MKRWESAIVPGGLAVAGLVFLFAALKPALGGNAPINVPFLLFGVVCVVAGLALWRKRDDGEPPRS
jgi:hypothetical protein